MATSTPTGETRRRLARVRALRRLAPYQAGPARHASLAEARSLLEVHRAALESRRAHPLDRARCRDQLARLLARLGGEPPSP